VQSASGWDDFSCDKMLKGSPTLVILPIIGVFLLLICVYITYPSPVSFMYQSLQLNSKNLFETLTCASCPSSILDTDCSDKTYPVMGGVDVVQYFIEFKNADGTYNETKSGSMGSSDYSSVYDGYTFYFKSISNQETFELSPTTYLPQYGGFCAWAVAGESCPSYAWSDTCMGPSGVASSWTIRNDKIYFFYDSGAKSTFVEDTDNNIAYGDSRWSSWFSSSHFNTACYSTIHSF